MRTPQTNSQFIENWDAITKLKCFEITLQSDNNEIETYLFWIELQGKRKLYFQVKSELFCIKSYIDIDFSIDENLQKLYEEIINKCIENGYNLYE